MENDELPTRIRAKVDEWLGIAASVRHFWQIDETFIVLAQTPGRSELYCLRVFPVGDSLQLSRDNVLYF